MYPVSVPVSAGAFKQALSNLWPQKTKKTKNRNFRPQEAREVLGRWDNDSNTVKSTEIPHLRSLPSEKTPGQKFKFPEFTFLGCWSFEWRAPSGPLKALEDAPDEKSLRSLSVPLQRRGI